MKRRNFVKYAGHGLALGSVTSMALLPHAATAPLELISSFAHGSSVAIELPGNTEFIQHAGFGTVVRLRPGADCWLHAAVPTPLVLSGPDLKLAGVRARFITSSADIAVDRIDVYDGEILIQSQDDLALSGGQDFGFGIDPMRPLSFGLGISLHVVAGLEALSHEIQFFSSEGTFLVTE